MFWRTGEWKRLGNKELYDLYDLYPSPNIILVIKSRKIRWARHVAHYGGRRGACKVLVGKPEGKRQLGRSRPGGRIILKCIFKKWNGEAWIGLIWLRKGTGCRGMWMWQWAFGVHTIEGVSWLAEGLLLYAFFWVISWHLNFICQHFGTLCLFHIHRRVCTCMKND